ncbi:putative exodeoxyribonuclease I [Medicago truncatula]|uniref:Exonuclease 1 n=1 Tax=Medicago truncatula TaxID=3880 RepID=A0A072TGL8_MEDTR|nr:exonuclease 1 [Medicago truncatula]KEH16709.1 5'-3' exonuclease family protein [Medicago truncatula]RHN52662.1 putative exodeoxyribonuclease I [Medicago truncatula]
MGIKDLLRFMKPYVEPIHIKNYAGKRVGIDAYSWLHKGAYSCSMELCLDSNSERKLRYIEYFMHRVNLLRYYNVTPVVVFDGGNVPCKAATEKERNKKRNTNRELAMAKLKEGNVNAASELFQRAVNITPVMAHKLIQTLKSENIEFVVAPYEADAQLAYLSNLETEKGGIAAVITEDSDLLTYGCPAVIFKMDREGNGERIELEKVFSAESCKPSFQSFNMKLFTGMCVLAGCDFLPSVPGIGVARAHALVSKYRNIDRILSVLKLEKGDQMPEDYAKSFKDALAVFEHARIYDINTKELKHMKPLPESFLESLDEDLNFLGPEIPSTIVKAIAEGNLNPSTKEAFDKSECSRLPLHPIDPHTIGQLKKSEVPTIKQDNCFSIFGSQNTNKNCTVTRLSDKDKYSNEVTALQKLIMPLETNETMTKPFTFDETHLKVPNNNPFRIRKHEEEISLVQKEETMEEISIVSSGEYIDLNDYMSPINFQEEGSINLLKKRKFENVCLDKVEVTDEQVSGVTEVENCDGLCLNMESQESVKSKIRNSSDLKGSGGSEKKSKKKKESNIRTILSFFSKV